MEIITYILIAILGLCVGSFLNVLIYRVPNKMSIVSPPSHCTSCNHKLSGLDNIPILSYIFLRGKCRYCKEPISPRYMLVEIANCLLWLGLALIFWQQSIILTICYCIATSLLLVIVFIDIEYHYIPDRFQIVLLLLGIVLAIFGTDMLWSSRIIGFFIGGGIMLLFYGLGYLIFKREAMGIGDIKLLAVCGLLLGWQNILLALIISSLFGSIVLLIIKHKNLEKQEFAFAPFLSFGVLIAMILGEKIINLYTSLFI